MNSASLVVTLLLLGQTGPATRPAKSPLGPRYQSSPAATAGQGTSGQGTSGPGAGQVTAGGAVADPTLPSLPGRTPDRYAPGVEDRFDAAGQGSAPASNPDEIILPGSLSPNVGGGEISDGDIDTIDMPKSRIGAAVGDNPFPAPMTANPLRGSDNEVPPVDAGSVEAGGPVGAPNFGAAEVGGAAIAPATVSNDFENEPRQFVPAGTRQAPEADASSFTPAVIDDKVTPASVPAGSQLVAVAPPDKEATPDRLLREALTPPEINSLAGKPVTLDELLGNRESVGERHATVVRTYWQLCAAIARHHWALEELQTLEEVTAGRQVPFSVSAELTALRARTLQTQAAAVEAQHALAVFRQRPAGTELPLPVDRPVVASYRTYYESLFAGRSVGEASVRAAQRLHETLPLHLQAAKALAEAVAEAEDLARPASNATPQGQLDLGSLIQSIRHLHTQREAFMAEVEIYNQSIAEYAMLAVSPGSTASSLLPMLIKVKPRSETALGSTITPQPTLPTVVPVGASEVITPATPAISNGVVPAAAEIPLNSGALLSTPGGEKQLRSVLVRSNRR